MILVNLIVVIVWLNVIIFVWGSVSFDTEEDWLKTPYGAFDPLGFAAIGGSV